MWSNKYDGSEVCNVGVQRNNFLQLIKVIKQWKFYLNLWYKIIWYCKTINLHAKLGVGIEKANVHFVFAANIEFLYSELRYLRITFLTDACD